MQQNNKRHRYNDHQLQKAPPVITWWHASYIYSTMCFPFLICNYKGCVVILINFCLFHFSSFKKSLEYEKRKAPTDEKQTKLVIMRSKYSSSHHRQKALVKSISLDLVVDCGVPMSIVEKQAFTRFLSVADESFNNVNRWVTHIYNLVYWHIWFTETDNWHIFHF